ncbi:MAG: regulatory iron-sulfur-containing complex subunit RicT, partial [bacterium]
MPHGVLRRRKTPLVPLTAPATTPLLLVQSGLLREKFHVLAPPEPVQLRQLILWSNEEDAVEWGIVAAHRTLGDLAREEYDEVIGRYLQPVGETEWPRIAELRASEAEDRQRCAERIANRRLQMQLLGVDWRFDRSKVTFHFAAEHRVDFRMLVRDLATIFRCRIELHQVGVRDETAILGGMGSCGRELCCHQHLDEFPTVSVKMARMQNL